MLRYRTVNREKLLSTARILVRVYGESLTLEVFRHETGFSDRLIRDLCGSWTQLRIDIGLTPSAPRAQPKYTFEQLQEMLRRAVDELGPNLSVANFCRFAGISPRMITRRCGSWRQLFESIRVLHRNPSRQVYSDRQIMDDLLQVFCRCQTFPPFLQYSRLGGHIAAKTIRDRFGSWSSVRTALEIHIRDILRSPPVTHQADVQQRWARFR